LETRTVNIHQGLIDACRAGDRAAQNEIYKLYYKAMFNTCLRIVNDTAEAEDIMQESFLDAFQRIGSYSGTGTFGSWLKRIVVNRSLDYLRKKKEIISLGEEETAIPDPGPDKDEETVKMQIGEVKEAMAKLSDEYRVILSLFLVEGYDHEEISEILNISYNNSRTRYSRARQKLLSVIRENREKRSFIYN
jgi:RNA polymerase sigma factor (sigma-70 family)